MGFTVAGGAIAPDTAASFVALTLGANIGSWGTPFAAALGAAKDGLGIIRLRGLVKPSASIAANSVVATLPDSSYWPAATKLFTVPDGNTSSGSIQVTVLSDGTIRNPASWTTQLAMLDPIWWVAGA